MTLVSRLRAAAHLDRLRILGLCAHADLTVCQLAEILGLRREHVVRHVRLLARADFSLLQRTTSVVLVPSQSRR
ncbi:ArsR family transcriptional regulator [Mesorhizobium sp. M0204]